jgi:hypothetical protein
MRDISTRIKGLSCLNPYNFKAISTVYEGNHSVKHTHYLFIIIAYQYYFYKCCT